MLLFWTLALVMFTLALYQWATTSLSIGVQIGGVPLTGTVERTGVGALTYDPLLPAAQAGNLTTRTDADTGVVTLDDDAVPTVVASDKVTIVWSGGERHGMTVTGTSGFTVSIDGGSGDALPTVLTDVEVCKEITLDVNVLGTLITLFGWSSPTETYIDVQEVSGTSPSTNPQTIAANEGYFWWDDGPVTNPFATVNIGSVIVANLDSTQASQSYLGIQYDAD